MTADISVGSLEKLGGNRIGFNGGSPGGHFIKHRKVKITVYYQGETSGNGGGRHGQKMRFFSLFGKGRTLFDTETVLLIAYNKSEIFKNNLVLDKSMGADDKVNLTAF